MSAIRDSKAREQALDLTRSFIVQAPAGSGKTELLIQRYLGLLGAVEQPEQILAMTFTRKAAGEMKSRIIAALEKAKNDSPPETRHEHKTWRLAQTALSQNDGQGWRLLENPSRLKIQTIDSFCAALTRQMPVLSQTGGTLSIEENAQELYRETAHRILHQIESNSSIGNSVRTIHSHLDNLKSGFLKRIIHLLQKRDQWMIPFFDNFGVTENSRAYLEQTLSGLIETVLEDAIKSFPPQAVERLVPLAAYSGRNLTQNLPEESSHCLEALTALPGSSVENIAVWKALTNLLLTKQGEFRKSINVNQGFPAGKAGSEAQEKKNELSDLLDSLAKIPELSEILAEVQNLPSPRFTDEEWNVLKETLNLLPEIAGTLRKIFTEQQKTDFTEISLSALKALGKEDDPTDLLLYLDTKFQHILVDEYQDTSFKQHELLKLLTAGWERDDGRSLFIVGDPMQSIYRFRDAEVGLFLRTQREGIGDIQLNSLTLESNFRSQKKIVDWVNACFSTIFPKFDDEDLGAISYSASSAALPEDPEPGIALHPVSDFTNLEDRANEEARQITDLVLSLRKTDPERTVALLVRARTHLPAIIRHFQEAGIAIKAEEIDPLTARPAIQDLLALMGALLSPWDRISWLSILRAPWCGLLLADLHDLCELDSDSTVWQMINGEERISSLSQDGQLRLKRFIEVMAPTLDAFPYSNFRDLLEGCWIRLGGPACVDPTTMEDIEVFFDEVTKTVEAGDFFQLHQFQNVLNNLYASPSVSTENPVQVMTMHKAKGLEFDHVLLPGLGKLSKAEEKRLVYWIPHGDDLLLAPIEESGGPNSQVYDFLSRMDRKKDEFESLRLLYVAATRTKKQLHLFGHAKQKDESIYPEKNSLLSKLWPYLGEEWKRGLSRTLEEAGIATPQEKATSHSFYRLPQDFHFPDPLPDIAIDTAPESEYDAELHPEYVWAGNRARCLGNVLHRCFKDIADQGVDRWSATLGSLEAKLKTALLEEGLPPTQLDETVRAGMTALQNTLEDESGRWILTNHEDGQSEYSLTGFIDNRYVNRILDRTFVDAQGTRWIIDYKTGEHQGADLEHYFKEEIKRYKPQLDQYEELIKLKGESRPIKKALYYPLHKKLVEVV
ncbi:MAG: ATP-dependent helicase [Nitrospinaceae bacterium]|nr:MAG: ATP-dependent helicase [Nitrospinaceae bacterium]